ncbi:MAG: DNA replication/repair protein RecF [Acidimicrobiales bacterium]|nr:MAG: DNA replication/repair protein RecF [Acidimicrobiales bacterium]
MYVQALALRDFRSYACVDLELVPGVNLFVGPNGHGKTNLMEAVGYIATLSSHRVSSDIPLVRRGASSAIVRCTVISEQRELLVELELVPGKANRARLNHSPVARPRAVLGALRSVLFAPEDLALIRGDPAERRRFIDDFLVTRSPRFAGVRADYDRALKQRNALLKSAGIRYRSGRRRGGNSTENEPNFADLPTLEVWNVHVARHGAELLAGRLAAIHDLSPYVEKAYHAVSESAAGARLGYSSSLTQALSKGTSCDSLNDDQTSLLSADKDVLRSQLLAGLAQVRSAELERGTTLVGPHRDDLILRLGELPAKGYASHGESWSYALALRLACFELLRAEGSEPVLILDDVFSELDNQRRKLLGDVAIKASQVLITAAVAEDIPSSLLQVRDTGARFDVADGVVRRVY